MKLPDTNLWLALSLSGHVHHQAAVSWLEIQTNEQNLIFCRSTQQSFLRLLTTPAVLAPFGIAPLSNRQAWAVFDSCMSDDRIIFRPEPAGVEAVWKKLAARSTHSPKLWMDAYLAAFAIVSGAELVTTDKAFTQFAGLKYLVIK